MLSGIASAVVLAAYFAARRHPVGNRCVPEPVCPVDLQRYVGQWYEIARYEQVFQKDCDGVTATYSALPDGKIGILNTCRKPDGRPGAAAAKACVVPKSGNTKLKVSFFGPFYIGNYWIMDHADDYEWAIVGDPSGRYLWLLDRRPCPPHQSQQALAGRAAALGYDTSMLRWTQQP